MSDRRDEHTVLQLLRFAETHDVDVNALLLVLAWRDGERGAGSGGAAEGDDGGDGERGDVPAHYYPH